MSGHYRRKIGHLRPWAVPLCGLALTLWSGSAHGQLAPPDLSATPLPVGSGARALARGGAFVAVADDATAASWNPAGLVQLERPEFSIVGAYLLSVADFQTDDPLTDIDQTFVGRFDLNYLSLACPFRLFGRHMVGSLNYQQKLDYHQEISQTRRYIDTDWDIYSTDRSKFRSEGGIGALSPALGVQVVPGLSLGLAVNIFTDEFFGDKAWEEREQGAEVGTFGGIPFRSTYDSRETFSGFSAVNFSIGLLWDAWEEEERRLTLGVVIHTPYTAELRRETNFYSVTRMSGSVWPYSIEGEVDDLEIDFPMSVGGGLSFHLSDALSFACDLTWTDWSSYWQVDSLGRKSRPLGQSADEPLDIADTFDTRLGVEYLLFFEREVVALRAGTFHEQRLSLGSPSDVFGFSLGAGITTNRFSVDWAYQFRYGDDMGGRDIGLAGAEYDVQEHLFLASVIWYF